ncbi:SAM-dependent methyltransferase [Clostridia bacterium]|nr:SAM-dependent methyltransferase [Clostridia bacterium]
MLKISHRLKAIANLLTDGQTIVDIGTDHAYLLIHLIEEKKYAQAVGVDIHKGPYKAAIENVAAHGLQDSIEIRLGDGLGPVSVDEMDRVAIAGMGGHTICKILTEYPEKTDKIKQLVLQPQSSPERVRKLLLELGFGITNECLIKEDKRLYLVLSASRETSIQELSWENLQIGPVLLENGSLYLVEYMGDMLHHKQFILNSLRQAKTNEQEKMKALEDEIEKLGRLIERYED